MVICHDFSGSPSLKFPAYGSYIRDLRGHALGSLPGRFTVTGVQPASGFVFPG